MTAMPCSPLTRRPFSTRRRTSTSCAGKASATFRTRAAISGRITTSTIQVSRSWKRLAYAITDLGYRLAWNIADILMPQTPSGDPARALSQPGFLHGARDPDRQSDERADDFRRVLIDLPSVRDAWLICKQCACEVSYWAFCDISGQLVLQYRRARQSAEPGEGGLGAWALRGAS